VDYCVFIQANDRQMLSAIVAEYALRRYSQHNDRFDVRIMNYDDIPVFRQYEGQRFLRDRGRRVWVRECVSAWRRA